MQLSGKKVLVTGGARRVGRAIVLAVAGRGADVLIHYRTSADEAERTADEARRAGVTAVTLKADLADTAAVTELIESARGTFGRVDVLVNNAAVYRPTPFESVTEDDWDRHMSVNLKAPFLIAVALGRAMARQGGGKIINLADWAGERPYRGFLPYCVSKAALIGLTRALALELAPTVQVNAVSPGPVANPEGFSREELQGVPMANPLGRIGSPDDVAAAVVFLVEGSDFITGSLLPVDGGWFLAR